MPSPPLAPVKRTHANLTPVALAFGGNALLLLVIACAQRRALGLVKRKTFTLIGRQDDDDLDMIVDDKGMQPTIPCSFAQDRDPNMDEEARADVDGETRQVDVNEGEGELAEEDQDELDSDEDVEEDHGVEGPEDHDEDGAHEEDDEDDENGKDKTTKPLTKTWCAAPKGNQVYVMDI